MHGCRPTEWARGSKDREWGTTTGDVLGDQVKETGKGDGDGNQDVKGGGDSDGDVHEGDKTSGDGIHGDTGDRGETARGRGKRRTHTQR